MVDGIYSITFRGYSDWGMGLLLFQRGTITGADAGGVIYDGSYADRGDSIFATVRMRVPAGQPLVQGTPPKSHPYEFSFDATIAKSALNNEETVPLQMAPGPVNVIFRKLRNL